MVNFSKVINRKGTYSTQWDYIEDRFGRNDILPFGISDMDFKSPKEILNVLKKRIKHGVFGYSRWNNKDYKNAIINWYSKRFNYNISEDWIMYTPNVIYTIIKIFDILNTNNDKILFFSPAYDNFFKSLKASNYNYVNSHLIIENNKFVIDWTDFEEKITQCKFLLLCNPNNPTGRAWTKEELSKIVNICKKNKVIIVSDDIHMDIVYKPNIFTPIFKVAEELDYINECIIVTSCSKIFNVPALGGAYCLIPNKDFFKKLLKKIGNQDSLGSAMILGLLALITRYNQCDYWVDDLLKYCSNNFEILKNFLHTNFPEANFICPDATYLAWIDVSFLNLNMDYIQNKLVNVGKVGIMRGDIYGEEKPFLRLNLGCSKNKLIEGLNRMKKALT